METLRKAITIITFTTSLRIRKVSRDCKVLLLLSLDREQRALLRPAEVFADAQQIREAQRLHFDKVPECRTECVERNV